MGDLHTAINSGVIKGPGSPFYKAISSCSALPRNVIAMEICYTFGICSEWERETEEQREGNKELLVI